MPQVAVPATRAGCIQLRSGLTMAALCARLHKLGALGPARCPGEARELNQVFSSPATLFQALANNSHFRRDSALGAIFHGQKLSFREVSPSDSLHVVFDGENVSAHVDALSPLNFHPRRSTQYSPARVVAHNLAGMAGDVARLINRSAVRRAPVKLALGGGSGMA